MLRPLPFVSPERLVRFFELTPDGDRFSVSAANYLGFSRENRTLQALAAVSFPARQFTLLGEGEPIHFQGVEWFGQSVVLYATGDLVDDYRLVPDFRNDRQLVFEVVLSERGVEQVRAYPLELDLGRTCAAAAEARPWIARRFTKMCGELGSRVARDEAWLAVLPG